MISFDIYSSSNQFELTSLAGLQCFCFTFHLAETISTGSKLSVGVVSPYKPKVASSVGRGRPVAPPRPGFDSHVERISGPWGKKIPSLCSPQDLALSDVGQGSGVFPRPGEAVVASS